MTGLVAVTGALTSATLANQQEQQSPPGDTVLLDALTVAFAALAVALFVDGTVCLIFFIAIWIWRYFHAVKVLHDGQWYCRYWPLQRIVEVSGVRIGVRDWAGNVKVACTLRVGETNAVFPCQIPGGQDGPYGASFGQQAINLPIDPNEEDPVSVLVRAVLAWWRGRPSTYCKPYQLALRITARTKTRKPRGREERLLLTRSTDSLLRRLAYRPTPLAQMTTLPKSR